LILIIIVIVIVTIIIVICYSMQISYDLNFRIVLMLLLKPWAWSEATVHSEDKSHDIGTWQAPHWNEPKQHSVAATVECLQPVLIVILMITPRPNACFTRRLMFQCLILDFWCCET